MAFAVCRVASAASSWALGNSNLRCENFSLVFQVTKIIAKHSWIICFMDIWFAKCAKQVHRARSIPCKFVCVCVCFCHNSLNMRAIPKTLGMYMVEHILQDITEFHKDRMRIAALVAETKRWCRVTASRATHYSEYYLWINSTAT